jgi:hypothetical protein
MRKQNIKVFDDFVYATAIDQVWTDASFNDALGRFDQISIIAVTDSAGGTMANSLSVQLENSIDGRNWTTKNSTPEINGQGIGIAATTTIAGSDGGTMPSGGLVRLSVWVGAATGTPSAHVKIYVCNRDQG